MKKFFIYFAWLCLAQEATAQTGAEFGAMSTQTAPLNSTSHSIKTFANNGNALGSAENSVNLFTGDVALPVPLINLAGRNGLDVSVGLSYSSNVQHNIGTWNPEAPSGVAGVGWSLDSPKIIINHKQTTARDDDDIYLVQGGQSSLLIRSSALPANGETNYPHTTTTIEYKTKNHSNAKIVRYLDTHKWEITQEDGTKYIYGDLNSNRNTLGWVVCWGNWIGDKGSAQGQNRMPYIFSLSETINKWGERIQYEYELDERNIAANDNGFKFTGAVHLKRITDVFYRQVVFYYQNNTWDKMVYENYNNQIPFSNKYLDKIEVLQPDNSLSLTIKMMYSNDVSGSCFGIIDYGTTRIKSKLMLCTITQYNAKGQAMPSMKFNYYTEDGTTGKKGFLKDVVLPTGAKQTYTYKAQGLPLKQSIRNITATAPLSYSCPQIWAKEDYVAITWLNRNDNSIILHIYHWVGKWVMHDMGWLGKAISHNEYGNERLNEYKGVFTTFQDNFFAIAIRNDADNTKRLKIFYKDETKLSHWNTYTYNVPSEDFATAYYKQVTSGEKFVLWHTWEGHAKVFTFKGADWAISNLPHCLSCRYSSANNYIIRHDMRPNPDHITLHYLTDALEWRYVNMNNANNWGTFVNVCDFWGNCTEYIYTDVSWHGNNVFTFLNTQFKGPVPNPQSYFPETFCHWDKFYGNIQTNDIANMDESNSFFMISHNALGISASQTNAGTPPSRYMRFDGIGWYATEGTYALPAPDNYGLLTSGRIMGGNDFGHDMFLHHNLNNGNGTILKVFLPSVGWQTQEYGNIGGGMMAFNYKNPLRIGKRCIFVGNKIYFADPQSYQYTLPKVTISSMFGASYYLNNSSMNIFANGAFAIESLEMKQNPPNAPFLGRIGIGISLGKGEVCFIKNNGDEVIKKEFNGALLKAFENSNTLITAEQLPLKSATWDITRFFLHRLIDEDIKGEVKDYPVEMVTLNNTVNGVYECVSATKFEYDNAGAIIDASGTVAQYPKVSVSKLNPANMQAETGRTDYYFHNGLVSGEVGLENAPQTTDVFWKGSPYKTEVFNNNGYGNLIAKTQSTFQTYQVQFNSSPASHKMYYARPIKQESTQDGITTTTETEYNQYGQVKVEKVYDPDSKGNKAVFTIYEYLWEKDQDALNTGWLSPVVGIRKELRINVGNIWNTYSILSNQVTIWKKAGSIWHEQKAYAWKRIGSPEFNYSSATGTNEPNLNEWDKLWEINAIDTKGNVLQRTSK